MNICEYIRKESINNLFNMNSFSTVWNTWKTDIESRLNVGNPSTIFNLGDSLSDIFRSTSQAGRSNSVLSSGGACWEALVCWYLNLTLIGTRTVVIKHSKKLIPEPIADSITVTYDNFKSNTESDLIAITFPNIPTFNDDISTLTDISIDAENTIPILKRNGTFNYNAVINYLSDLHFDDIKICVIQCKTNWNDNAQIPMLWDMIYSGERFSRGVVVGVNGYGIKSENFKYAFVTVPSNSNETYTSDKTCVKRVRNLSGGNYWGKPTENDVAKSIKEMITSNFLSGINGGSVRNSIRANIANINTTYNYFKITL